MNKLILPVAISFISLCMYGKEYTRHETNDTIIFVDDKKIEISESGDRTKVKVFELNNYNEYVESVKVFEGHYIDGVSYENRRYIKNTKIPNPTWNKGFDPHWAGFGMGFANFADGSLTVNGVDGVHLKSESSFEYNVNFMAKSFPFSQHSWAFVTGMGMRWNRYKVKGNEYFKEVDNVTSLLTLADGMNMTRSRLNTTSLTIPLLLEWQNRSNRFTSDFFVSFGVVGVIKTISSSRIQYRDEDGHKHKVKVDRGMNIHPVSMDLLLQAGYRHIGVFAKYAPVKMFEKNKGPEVHPVSLGLHLYIY